MVILSYFGASAAKLHYNYFLELCSLIILTAITIAYFSRKKFPVAIFKLFGVCLISITTNVALDILFCVLLDNSDVIPIIYAEIAAELFFFAQVFCSYLLFAYIFYSIRKSLRYSPIYLLTIIPSAICAILLFTNYFHHWCFSFVYNDASGVYDFVQGPAFVSLFILAFLNFFSTIIYTIAFRKTLKKQLLFVLVCVIGIVIIAAIIQTIQPKYLLSGVAFTLSAIFVTITVNDPDEKVDRISKAFNNDAFIDYINNQRMEKQRKYYIVFDIESFGMFNEKFGVVYSNELVFMIRKYIESVNKKTYIFKTQSARFVLLLKTKEEQMKMLEDLKYRFSMPFHINDRSINVTIHLFYFVNDDTFKNSDSYNDFINKALLTINFKDTNYVELDNTFIERVNRDRRIREILERCLKSKKGLYMVYQPIYDINKKCFNHFEALIRLDNDELGYVGPAEFIPIAENYGLANEIDYFVLNETCAFLQRNPQVESLEINISCAEFFNNPSERFIKTINKYDIDPRKLCLEITETVAVKYPEKTQEFMDDLGQHGIQFAMDDFGSGYSNMARFITLPFSIAKLDKSLLDESKNVEIFLDAAVSIFKNLNIPIVIEGVETEKQLKLAKDKRLDYIQGFYFSKPLKEEDLREFLIKNKG